MLLRARNGAYLTSAEDVDKGGLPYALSALRRDVNLMVQNCIDFNGTGTWYAIHAAPFMQCR